MTKLKYLQKFFFLLVMGISLSFICACGDDEEEPVQEPEKEESLGIIGTWRHEFSTGFYYIYFDKAGYGWDHEYDEADGGWYDKELFTYVYDATNRVIVIKYEDEIADATVVALSETKLVLDFGQSTGIEFYERISDGEYKTGDEEIQKPEPEETPNLVGTWRYEFGNDYHFLYFDKIGCGWEKQYDKTEDKWYDDPFTYVYDNSTKNLTLEYTDGYITEMTVEYLSESVLVFDGFHEDGRYYCDRMSNGEYIPNNKDQNHKIKKDLTGTWCYEYDGSFDYWYFDGLGNGWRVGTWNDKESFTYVYDVYDDSDKEYGDPADGEYNDSDGKIVIYYEDGYDMTYKIDFHSDNAIQMIIDAPDLKNSYYVRISNDEIKSIENE